MLIMKWRQDSSGNWYAYLESVKDLSIGIAYHRSLTLDGSYYHIWIGNEHLDKRYSDVEDAKEAAEKHLWDAIKAAMSELMALMATANSKLPKPDPPYIQNSIIKWEQRFELEKEEESEKTTQKMPILSAEVASEVRKRTGTLSAEEVMDRDLKRYRDVKQTPGWGRGVKDDYDPEC